MNKRCWQWAPKQDRDSVANSKNKKKKKKQKKSELKSSLKKERLTKSVRNKKRLN